MSSSSLAEAHEYLRGFEYDLAAKGHRYQQRTMNILNNSNSSSQSSRPLEEADEYLKVSGNDGWLRSEFTSTGHIREGCLR